MGEKTLKTAVLGLKDKGRLLLDAISGFDYFELTAVADKDSELAGKTAQRYGCAPYGDYRQLVIQNQLDCLLVAAGTHSCAEHIKAAMKKKCSVFKLAPAARDFEEAAGFMHLAEQENVRFAVANTKRFAGSFLALRQFLQEGEIEGVFLITATCAVGDRPHPAWQTDPKLAGGGVLLHDCYEIIDQIVWNFGVPEQVYSLNSNAAGDRQQRQYLTEDTVLVTMKFSDTFMGTLLASRRMDVGSGQELLKIYGKDKIVTVSDRRFVVSDHLGQPITAPEYEDDELACVRKHLENFAVAILLPDKNKLCSSISENLNDMAVIESAYVSARTGMPEEPGRILEMVSRQAGKVINV